MLNPLHLLKQIVKLTAKKVVVCPFMNCMDKNFLTIFIFNPKPVDCVAFYRILFMLNVLFSCQSDLR